MNALHRYRGLCAGFVAVALLCAETAAPATLPTPAAALIAAVTAERAAAGLGGLVPDGRLACAARAHARDLAAHDRFEHSGSDGGDLATRLGRVGYAYRMAAENLALAGAAAGEIVALWRASPGHNRNMRQSAARAAGAARVRGTDGRYIWVLVVAAEMTKILQKPPILANCDAIPG